MSQEDLSKTNIFSKQLAASLSSKNFLLCKTNPTFLIIFLIFQLFYTVQAFTTLSLLASAHEFILSFIFNFLGILLVIFLLDRLRQGKDVLIYNLQVALLACIAILMLREFQTNINLQHFREVSYHYLAVFIVLALFFYHYIKELLVGRYFYRFNRFLAGNSVVYSKLNSPQKILKNDLQIGDQIVCNKSDLVPFSSTLIAENAVFACECDPLKFSRYFLQAGDQVPAGSYLVAGKGHLEINSLDESRGSQFLESYLADPDTSKIKLSSFIAMLLIAILVFYYLELSLVHRVFVSMLFGLSFSVLLDFGLFICRSKLLVKQFLAESGVLFSNEKKLFNSQYKLKLNESQQFMRCSKLQIFNDQVATEKLALIIFYLCSNTNRQFFNIIREYLEQSVIKKYLSNPLDQIKVEDQGIEAHLEYSQLYFGTESYLLEHSIVLNTNEVLAKDAKKKAFYLAIDKEIVAGIEVVPENDENVKQSLDLFINSMSSKWIASLPSEKSNIRHSTLKISQQDSQVIVEPRDGDSSFEGTSLYSNMQLNQMFQLKDPSLLVVNSWNLESLSLLSNLLRDLRFWSKLYCLLVILLVLLGALLFDNLFLILQLIILLPIVFLLAYRSALLNFTRN